MILRKMFTLISMRIKVDVERIKFVIGRKKLDIERIKLDIERKNLIKNTSAFKPKNGKVH